MAVMFLLQYVEVDSTNSNFTKGKAMSRFQVTEAVGGKKEVRDLPSGSIGIVEMSA